MRGCLPMQDNDRGLDAGRASCGEPSCSSPPSTCSWPRATTPPRWTTSPNVRVSPSRCCTSTSRASSSSTWPCSTPPATKSSTVYGRRWRAPRSTRSGSPPRPTRSTRTSPTPTARSGSSSSPTSPANRPSANASTASTRQCADAIAEVIADDTGFPPEASRLLAVALVGMSQVSARYWLSDNGGLPQAQATELIASLAWRGIRGFPRHE